MAQKKAGWLLHAHLDRLCTVVAGRVHALTDREKLQVLKFQLPNERHDHRVLVGGKTRAPFFKDRTKKPIFYFSDR